VGNAERLAAKLQARGVEAYYFKRENGLYAVRFGDFRSWDEAKKSATKLAGEKLIGSYFIADPGTPVVIKKGREPEVRKEPPAKQKSRSSTEMGDVAARTAERFVGIPYRWGGENVVDGMDCSGFARAVYNLCGVNIPRTSAEQFRAGESVPKEELQDGDLVFFGESASRINHVGIYVGDNRFVHAPRRGDDIKVSSLDEGYFVKRFVGARRYF
jgi:cell wall-associated NlpC family hydrolase